MIGILLTYYLPILPLWSGIVIGPTSVSDKNKNNKYHQLQIIWENKYINFMCKDVLVYRHLAIINQTNQTKDMV